MTTDKAYKDVINLTQHAPTDEMLECAHFVKLSKEEQEAIKTLLTFETFEEAQLKTQERARALAVLARNANARYALIGGAPYLMAPLQQLLLTFGILPIYAFTKRVSEERKDSDGKVTKVSVFKFEGFVTAA